jgi:hypothetical protein
MLYVKNQRQRGTFLITNSKVSGIVGPIIDRQHSPPEVNTDITTF